MIVGSPCPYDCNNKSPFTGYCNTTACINQKYNRSGTYVLKACEYCKKAIYMKQEEIICPYCERVMQEGVIANKEIPIKPVNCIFWYFCKVCNTAVERQDKYCKGCGQKLDWSRDEKV